MRETRVAQGSIFESYSEHELGQRLKMLSNVLDQYPCLLNLVAIDLIDESTTNTGRKGLSVESVFRCCLLKQTLQLTYDQLAFHLSDSCTYRTFTRLPYDLNPSRSALQACIRKITPETLQKIDEYLIKDWIDQGTVDTQTLRIDSTVIHSNIAAPSDSQLLNDGVRVLSRLLVKSVTLTGIKIQFDDQRKPAKSLAFRIFNAKKAEKDNLYPELIALAEEVIQQAEQAHSKVLKETTYQSQKKTGDWLAQVEHYLTLLRQVVSQTRRRVIDNQKVPSSEKLVSLFEPHTDIIVKGFRDVQYGHKVNLSTEANGFITFFSIEEGNPSDKDLFMPVLDYHAKLGRPPTSTIADGGYASQQNVLTGKEKGVKRVAFQKTVGLTLQQMGLKQKTLKKLAYFRAGVEGNISELKRVFGASKAMWKSESGFKAYTWASVLCYNLMKFAAWRSG